MSTIIYTLVIFLQIHFIIQLLLGASRGDPDRGPSPEQAYPRPPGGRGEPRGWRRQCGHVPVEPGDGGSVEQAEGPHAGEG